MARVFFEGQVIAQGDIEQLVEMHSVGMFPEAADLSELNREKSLKGRRNAYALESDPLYIEYQYDNSEEKERIWRERVLEIKKRYPLTEE